MDYDYARPDIAAALRAARSPSELEPIFAKLVNDRSGDAPDVRGHKLFMREVDATIPHVARTLGLGDQAGTISNDRVCVVATQFYEIGGHSRVAADITRLIGGDRVTVMLSNLYGNARYRGIPFAKLQTLGFQHHALLVMVSATPLDRTVELYSILRALRPTRIFLLSHFFDIAAVTATYPFRSVTEFIHHADFSPALGATLPYARHVNLTYKAYLASKAIGRDPLFAGLTVPVERAEEVGPPATPKAGPRFATCGHLTKYRSPSRRRWTDWVISCLRNPGADMLHMGYCDDGFVAECRADLARAGVDPDRYRFLGNVANLQQELRRQDVDVYVSSYPESGGRANLEALAARKPVIVPKDPDAPPLLHAPTPLPGFIYVDDPGDMPQAIERALGMRAELQADAFGQALNAELSRFENYVALRPSPPLDPAFG